MLTPEYLDGIAEPVQEIIGALQTVIQQDIARRIRKVRYAKIPDTAAWQIVKLQELGESRETIQKAIARALDLSDKEVRKLFKEAGLKSLKPDIALQKAAIEAGNLPADVVSLTASESVAQVLNANAVRTMNTLRGLTGSTASVATGKLNEYLDMAQMMVQSGAYTPEQAVDHAVRRFAADGVSHFEYASGARITIEAGVRRAVVTGVNQATAEISLNNAAELDTNLVEVTSHADSRPSHAVWQGGIYSLSGTHPKYRGLREATGYGTAAGLCGANCRHSFYAYIEGVSEKLPKEEYDPKIYRAEQEQRANERKIRYWKRRAATLQAGGADNSTERARVAYWQVRQKEHVERHGLARLYDREQAYNRSGPIEISTSGIAARADKMYNTGSKAGNIEAYIRDMPVRRKIAGLPDTIESGRQNVHIAGTAEYIRRAEKLRAAGEHGPSRLTIGIDGAQKLINRYRGTGIIKRRRDGSWNNEEIITVHKTNIGVVVDNRDGRDADTTVFKIKYGKNGPHIVPDYPSKKGRKGS